MLTSDILDISRLQYRFIQKKCWSVYSGFDRDVHICEQEFKNWDKHNFENDRNWYILILGWFDGV